MSSHVREAIPFLLFMIFRFARHRLATLPIIDNAKPKMRG